MTSGASALLAARAAACDEEYARTTAWCETIAALARRPERAAALKPAELSTAEESLMDGERARRSLTHQFHGGGLWVIYPPPAPLRAPSPASLRSGFPEVAEPDANRVPLCAHYLEDLEAGREFERSSSSRLSCGLRQEEAFLEPVDDGAFARSLWDDAEEEQPEFPLVGLLAARREGRDG